MIYCDLRDGIVLPITQAQPIDTKGKGRLHQVWIWLTQSRTYRIMEDYVIYIPWLDLEILIPEGFIYDGASVPRLFWPLLPPDGILLVPALPHDFGYVYDCLINYKDRTVVHDGAGRAFWDKLFREMAVATNGMPVLSSVSYVGLATGSWIPWRRRRKANQDVCKDFPGVCRAEELKDAA
jgi:hypothetical protein